MNNEEFERTKKLIKHRITWEFDNKNPSHSNRLELAKILNREMIPFDMSLEFIKKLEWEDFNETITRNFLLNNRRPYLKMIHIIISEMEHNYPDSPDMEYDVVLCGLHSIDVMDVDDDDPDRKKKYVYPNEIREISATNICPDCWKTYLITAIKRVVEPKYKTKLKIFQINKKLTRPSTAYEGDAGFDLYSSVSEYLNPGEIMAIPTGIKIELDYGYEAQIRPRGGLAIKYGITIVNSPGTVDAGYRGEVMVILRNEGKKVFHVPYNTKICQMVIVKLPTVEVEFVENESDLSPSDRGEKRYGSSGS